MATTTPNLSLTKPAGSDAADIAVISANMDILDNAATLTGGQTLSNKTLTSPHMTTPVVDAGGLTITSGGEVITAGGLTVTAGNIGVGGVPSVTAGVVITGQSGATNNAYGVLAQPTGPNGAGGGGSSIEGVTAQPSTIAAAYTVAQAIAFHAFSPLIGSGSTITSKYGLLVDAITGAGTNNIGVDILAASGAATLNLSLRAQGGVRFSGLGARVAGDVYVIVDANGDLHKSAIGPAS